MARQRLVLCAVLVLPALAWASDGSTAPGARTGPLIVQVAEPAEAPAVPPEDVSPPQSTTPPPQSTEPDASGAAVPEGRWVHTPQYGWVWIPWGEGYTHVPPAGYGEPYAYVYYPSYGWTWVVAPWVWGWSAWPYAASWHLAFHGHGWWGHPGWHFRHRGFSPPHVVRPGPRAFRGVGPAPRPLSGGAPSRVAPAPPRGGGVAAPRGGGSAPAPRAAPRPR